MTKRGGKRKHSEIENKENETESLPPPTRNSDEPIEKKVCNLPPIYSLASLM